MSKQYTITKRFTRSINRDKNIISFATELQTTAEVASGEELVAESDKLFQQARVLTENDIAAVFGGTNNEPSN